jgi:septum formation protein
LILNNKKLVLASTSRYRAELLQRLQIPFDISSPQVDETPLLHETPAQTALRLALAKAQDVASRHTDAWVIGSDQVADLAGVQIGKPGTRDRAREQLRLMRGKSLIFHTALALVRHQSESVQSVIVPTVVRFRDVTDSEIDAYLGRENALDCAGSAKSEGLGIALMASMESSDPTSLIGLPLIALTTMLAREGWRVLT